MGETGMNTDLQRLVERHSLTLYRLAFSYCGNRPDAEDAVQETFVKLLSVRKTFDSDERLLNWLMLVTANNCRDLLRSAWRRKRRDLEQADQTAAQDPDPDTRLSVRQAIDRLPLAYRGIVYLYYYEEYPVKRIAAALGLTETAVRSRLDRARKQLKKTLGGETE